MTVYRPDVRCPRCKRKPPLDIPEEERTAARDQPPGRIRLHYVCRCGIRYGISAAAIANSLAVSVSKFVKTH